MSDDDLEALRLAGWGTKKKASKPTPTQKKRKKREECFSSDEDEEKVPITKKRTKKAEPILVLHNYGGRRCPPEGPKEVRDWGLWDCDPSRNAKPTAHHGYGSQFDWTCDKEEKAYILEGTATLTPSDSALEPVDIGPKDMVTFPRGWSGHWQVHSFLKKRYAFFDGNGYRIDEDDTDEEELLVEDVIEADRDTELSDIQALGSQKDKDLEARIAEVKARSSAQTNDLSVSLKSPEDADQEPQQYLSLGGSKPQEYPTLGGSKPQEYPSLAESRPQEYPTLGKPL